MEVHRINDLSNTHVTNLLVSAFSNIQEERLIHNYNPDYRSNPANIFYILSDVNGRYKNGTYYVVENEGEYVCSAGWNEYEIDRSIALALTRAYVHPKYRALYIMGKEILPLILSETTKYDRVWITADEHNKSIFNRFYRKNKGMRSELFGKWPEIYDNFVAKGKQIIYNTEQYVIEYNK
jgi:hypothetical protein